MRSEAKSLDFNTCSMRCFLLPIGSSSIVGLRMTTKGPKSKLTKGQLLFVLIQVLELIKTIGAQFFRHRLLTLDTLESQLVFSHKDCKRNNFMSTPLLALLIKYDCNNWSVTMKLSKLRHKERFFSPRIGLALLNRNYISTCIYAYQNTSCSIRKLERRCSIFILPGQQQAQGPIS